MYKLSLINMPFAMLNTPSIALTQLKSVVAREFGDQVAVDILYLNHDFARFLGLDVYKTIVGSHEAQVTGLGDWLFRRLAFPDLPDNSEEYFRRYFPERDKQTEQQRRAFLERWSGADEFLDELIDKYRLDQADLVGFTSMFVQNVACFALSRKIKERNEGVVTIMGGANCEWPMGREIVNNVKHIDFVFSGPALTGFPKFIRHYIDRNIESCGQIAGVLRRANGTLPLATGAIGEELSIDVDVELDYSSYLDTLSKNFPNGEIKPSLLFETSRGCWWGERAHCTFCGLNGLTMNYRAMKPEKAVKLIESLFQYSSKVQWLEAVDNIMPKSYPSEVFSALETPANVSMFYEVKADLTDAELQILSKARVRTIQPGIESLATSTLKLMKKGTSAFQNVAFLKSCLLYEISPQWNLLVGFPGEGEDVYKKYLVDIPRLTHLPPPSGVFPVRFDRYSPYFVRAQEYGLDLHPLDYYSLIYPFDESSLANLAYYFDDRTAEPHYRVTVTKWLDQMRRRVDEWRVQWDHQSRSPHPQLFFKDSCTIYDSRSRKAIEHKVGPVGKRILEYLASPRRLTDIAAALSDIPDLNLDREVAFLQYRGLLFQEGDRFISLVLPKEPPVPIRS